MHFKKWSVFLAHPVYIYIYDEQILHIIHMMNIVFISFNLMCLLQLIIRARFLQ